MRFGNLLDSTMVLIIKEKLWHGAVQAEVAGEFNVSLNLINRIVAGYHWREVPWPDGSTGGMSDERKVDIARARQAARPPIKQKRTKDQNLVFAASMYNVKSPKQEYIERVLRIENMPTNRDDDNPNDEWVPADLEWAELMWEKHVEMEKREAKKELERHQKRINRPREEEDDVPETEEEKAERELNRKINANKLKMWKDNKPQFEYWDYVTQAEVAHMLNRENPDTRALRHEDAILAWAADKFKEGE